MPSVTPKPPNMVIMPTPLRRERLVLPQVGHFGRVIKGVQASFVALDALTVCLLPGLIFFFVEERIVVDIFFSDGFF